VLAGKVSLFWSALKEKVTGIRLSQSFLMLAIELLGALAILYGISWFSIPISLIIGGVGAIIAMETQSRTPKTSPQEILAVQERIKTALASNLDPFAQPGVPLTATWVAYAASLRPRIK
jgi:hypothetical protein